MYLKLPLDKRPPLKPVALDTNNNPGSVMTTVMASQRWNVPKMFTNATKARSLSKLHFLDEMNSDHKSTWKK